MITPNELNALLAKDSSDYTTADIDALKQSFADMSQLILKPIQHVDAKKLDPTDNLQFSFSILIHPRFPNKFVADIRFNPLGQKPSIITTGFYASTYELLYAFNAIDFDELI